MTPAPPRALPGSPRALLWLALLAVLAWSLVDQGHPRTAPGSRAQAIGAAEPEPEWIWAPGEPRDDQRVVFLTDLDLEQPMRVVGGAFTADNAFELLVDGELLVAGDAWQRPVAIEEGPVLEAGDHLLRVEAWNESGPAGLLGRLVLEDDGGGRVVVVTDGSWVVEGTPGEGAGEGRLAHSFGPASDHSGPWGSVDVGDVAPRVAPDPATFTLADGFVCERLYSAREADGSWASMTWSDDGRLFVSPERGSLLVFEPSDELLAGAPVAARAASVHGGSHAGGLGEPRSLAHLPVHAAQGLEWAHDSLYVSVSASVDDGGGLWRARDNDDDERLDAAERLVAYEPYSEHGAHGLRLAPDGDLYLVQGNFASGPLQVEGRPPLELDLTPTAHVREDVLLPRLWDPRGHAKGVLAPGGELWRCDPDGLRWTRVSVGMRNAYDIAVSRAGAIFTYDSDMEWDHGTPWYRLPAVYHLVSGADFGWRSGSAKWPREYPDTPPAVCETDLSSPTGVELGESGRFGAPWDQALFLGDWAWGRILAVHLEPHGATYRGEPEVFLEGRGVTITDLEFGPDGNLWFVTGGRGTQSGLYRVRPVGERSAARAELAVTSGPFGSWSNEDARLRAAALAVELAPTRSLGDLRLAMLLELRLPELAAERRAGWSTALAQALAAEPATTAAGQLLDRERARLAVAIDTPDLPTLLLPRALAPHPQEHRLHFLLLLRLVDDGWTPDLRRAYVRALFEARSFQGGASVAGYVAAIEAEALARCSEGERLELVAYLAELEAAAERAAEADGSGKDAAKYTTLARVRTWTTVEALAALDAADRAGGGDATRGAELFRAVGCAACHRIDGPGSAGGALGPDLTGAARRFTRHDLVRAIVEPAADRSDQYGSVVMPPGLVDVLDAAALADLFAHLEAPR